MGLRATLPSLSATAVRPFRPTGQRAHSQYNEREEHSKLSVVMTIAVIVPAVVSIA